MEDREIQSEAVVLVREIAQILHEAAGRAECGEKVKTVLSAGEILAALQIRTAKVRLSWLGVFFPCRLPPC